MNDTSVLVCLLAGEYFGVPLTAVREVIRLRASTPVPGVPPTIWGVIHQRGVVLPVVDVRSLLGVPTPTPGPTGRLVIVQSGEIQAALVADRVEDIVLLQASAESIPAALPPEQAQYLGGLVHWADRHVGLLQMEPLLRAIRQQSHG